MCPSTGKGGLHQFQDPANHALFVVSPAGTSTRVSRQLAKIRHRNPARAGALPQLAKARPGFPLCHRGKRTGLRDIEGGPKLLSGSLRSSHFLVHLSELQVAGGARLRANGSFQVGDRLLEGGLREPPYTTRTIARENTPSSATPPCQTPRT